MTPDIEQNRGARSEYSTKTIQYDEDGPGLYDIMMVRFDPKRNEPLDDAGYRNGTYVMYVLLGGGVRHASTDLHTFERQVAAADDETLRVLLDAAQSWNGWQRITDGERYDKSTIQSIFG